MRVTFQLVILVLLAVSLAVGPVSAGDPPKAKLGGNSAASTSEGLLAEPRSEGISPLANEPPPPDYARWTFFPSKGESFLHFDEFEVIDLFGESPAQIFGPFSINVSGITPKKPWLSDPGQAGATNAFSLRINGLINDTIIMGETGYHSIVIGGDGVLAMDDGSETWQIAIKQENFGILAPSLQIDRAGGRVRAFFPVLLTHSPSHAQIHAQLFLLFTNLREGPARTTATMVMQETSSDLSHLGYMAELSDLIASKPVSVFELPKPVIPPENITTISMVPFERQALGYLSNSEAVDAILCAESREVLACADPNQQLRGIELRLNGTPRAITGSLAESNSWQVDLLIYPVGSAKRPNGRVVTYFEQYSGAITAGETVYDAKQLLFGDSVGSSVYDPHSSEIAISLPLVVGNSGDPKAIILLEATCKAKSLSERHECFDATITDARNLEGIALGDYTIGALGTMVVSDLQNSNTLEAVFATDSYDPGCATFCPHCQGHSPDCGGGGSAICPLVQSTQCTGIGSPTCCLSQFRSACRTCQVQGCGGGGWDSVTELVRVDLQVDKLGINQPVQLQQLACQEFELSRNRTYASGRRVVREDWTVFEVSAKSGPNPVATSNLSHAQNRANCLNARRGGTYLVIDHIPHPNNENHIPLPHASLRGDVRLRGGGGRLVASFEFDDDGAFLQAQTIYSTLEVTKAELSQLQRDLALDYSSNKRHALTVYAFLDFSDDDGSLVNQEFSVVTPQCCVP